MHYQLTTTNTIYGAWTRTKTIKNNHTYKTPDFFKTNLHMPSRQLYCSKTVNSNLMGQASKIKIIKWLTDATAVNNDLFLAFTAVSGNPFSEESCIDTNGFLESLHS